jgi:hypothetical protein
MSIELDRGNERRMIQTAIRRQLVFAHVNKNDEVEALSHIITEALFEAAAVTVTKGPEAGIRAGRELIRNWVD